MFNPWLMVGGCATAVCAPDEYQVPDSAVAGDVLVLTKPLGTGVAINCHQWMSENNMSRIKMVISEEEIQKSYKRAIDVMGRSNKGNFSDSTFTTIVQDSRLRMQKVECEWFYFSPVKYCLINIFNK